MFTPLLIDFKILEKRCSRLLMMTSIAGCHVDELRRRDRFLHTCTGLEYLVPIRSRMQTLIQTVLGSSSQETIHSVDNVVAGKYGKYDY